MRKGEWHLIHSGNYDVDGDGHREHVDKAFLTNYLSAMSSFADSHHVPVAMTEFGVHRTASNSSQYLADRISIQNGLGNWAAWVWQPYGFIDPFNANTPSAIQNTLAAAWAGNCRVNHNDADPDPQEPDPLPGVVQGRTYHLKKRNRVGSVVTKVVVHVGAAQVLSSHRKPKGVYQLVSPAGAQIVWATKGKKRCRIGAPTGDVFLQVLVNGQTSNVDVFCP